jgi:hypothetical protein
MMRIFWVALICVGIPSLARSQKTVHDSLVRELRRELARDRSTARESTSSSIGSYDRAGQVELRGGMTDGGEP